MDDITRVLAAIEDGDGAAAERLLPLVYDELRRLASQRMSRESPGQTLQPTALVHEAYLRLVHSPASENWNGRGHFFAAAAEAMRRILIEAARRRRSVKHGGTLERRELIDEEIAEVRADTDVVELDTALRKLADIHPRKAEVVKLRYFAGLTSAEAAKMIGISEATAERDWSYARAWLHQAIVAERESTD